AGDNRANGMTCRHSAARLPEVGPSCSGTEVVVIGQNSLGPARTHPTGNFGQGGEGPGRGARPVRDQSSVNKAAIASFICWAVICPSRARCMFAGQTVLTNSGVFGDEGSKWANGKDACVTSTKRGSWPCHVAVSDCVTGNCPVAVLNRALFSAGDRKEIHFHAASLSLAFDSTAVDSSPKVVQRPPPHSGTVVAATLSPSAATRSLDEPT